VTSIPNKSRITANKASHKNFKIRRIIEYPDTEEEGEGGKEQGVRLGVWVLFLDFAKENVCFSVFLTINVVHFFPPGFGISRHH
jgi:hypothetical protein